ncbi:hypothetical protein Q7M76_03845 [Candidatus Liberibacter asiaticus]|uniref:Uncharacterized protein n=1 Tax=Liberibacter asiaticus (strain psy62) TaxID=537021 RepID=C6XG60_LIBAP|nr:hypothetical protein [Candidatus Liberibacter asiaticus]ACT57363.1 hypothetical protein CLIBASIA_03935 [Candidatus Liberibacter asiaticus str. psy62]KAE9509925.1 hypothetical protein FXW22_03770 [Candidatus Liberibacter asiaticus]KAE9510693.1 hypothetical protein FXW31_05340 [Candidatus Liberibacter asiaticus]KAE9512058.1 hypothetical protein FXW32_03825 [Candidatus Liberibacter asiaticus]KAE9513137.1 hypothetical protein FXW35_03910 [Candidatus Liberibacter asiaticus]
MFYDSREKEVFLESEVVHNIRLQIEEISAILSKKSRDTPNQEIRTKIYIITARIIALIVFREGEKSLIFDLLRTNQKTNSSLTQAIIQEIDTLQHQCKSIERDS